MLLLSIPIWTVAADDGNSITASFMNENITLLITSRCEHVEPICPFEAKISAPPWLFEAIEDVEYLFGPDHRTVIPSEEGASTHYNFTEKHMFGEDLHALVMLQPNWNSPGRGVLITGKIPYAADATPKLPYGLRFEDKYWEESLQGAPSGYHHFRVWLRGDPHALNQIRSVEYRLPLEYFTQTNVIAIPQTEYFLDGTAPSNSRWDISANIHWRDGTLSMHKIPFLPR